MFEFRGVLLAASASVALACGSHHVRLVTPSTTGSSLYICEKNGCRPSEIDDPALATQSNTAFIKLPLECHGRFNELLVRDADSDHPQVFARCAPDEPSGIPVMGETGAPSATQPAAKNPNDGPIPEMGDDSPPPSAPRPGTPAPAPAPSAPAPSAPATTKASPTHGH